MATITSTELGAAGRYVYFDQVAFDDLGSQTIIAYCRPTGSGGGGFGYVYGKTPTGSINGPRLFVEHNAGSPKLVFGASSSTAGKPTNAAAATAAAVAYNTWQHLELTWDGGLLSSGVRTYVDGTLAQGADISGDSGSGSITSDASNPAYIINRYGLGREFVGDMAYVAVWDRVLDSTERATVRTTGPLDVPTGLILLWANQADLGPNALTATGRSTYAAGAIPPNTALGGSAGVSVAPSAGAVVVLGNTPTVSQSAAITVAPAAGAVVIAGGVPTVTNAAIIVIADDFERSSVNVSGSSVSGTGDAAIITLKPRVQESEVVTSQTRWLTPLAKVSGLSGIRPTLKFSDYGSGAGKYHGYPWEAGRKPMFAYSIDGPWYYFDTTTIGASDITFRHNTAFTADTVYISKGRVRTPTQTGTWIDGLEAAYPSLIHTLPSTVSGFVSGTFAAQTDELGRTIPAQPFYAFKISDSSLAPAVGEKRAMVFVAGVHAGEDQGDLTLAAAVEFLLSVDLKAQNVRRHFDVYVYPLLNAPGRAGGGWRGSFTQGTAGADDANRHFSDASPGLEIVTIPRAAMTADLPAVIPVMIDFHGQYTDKWGLFKDIGVTAHDTFDTAIEVYVGAGQYVSLGASNAGFTTKYFADTYATEYYITTETGDPTPITDADITAFGAAHVKALSDLQEAGEFGLPVTVAPIAGAITVAGNTPAISQPITVSPAAGAAIYAGNTPTISQGASVSPTAGALSIAGNTPGISQPITVSPAAGIVSLAGNAPEISQAASIRPTAGAVYFSGNVPTISQPRTIAPGIGGYDILGNTPTVSQAALISPVSSQIVVLGGTPAISQPRTVAPTLGAVVWMGNVPTIGLLGDPFIGRRLYTVPRENRLYTVKD